jgi:hypothetical protein
MALAVSRDRFFVNALEQAEPPKARRTTTAAFTMMRLGSLSDVLVKIDFVIAV